MSSRTGSNDAITMRDPPVDSFELNRLSGLAVWLLCYLVHCFCFFDIRLGTSDVMADFADGADGAPTFKKQRAAKAKDGVDIYKQDASVSDLFGDLKGRILLEAIWNTYQARETGKFTHINMNDSIMFACSAGDIGSLKYGPTSPSRIFTAPTFTEGTW